MAIPIQCPECHKRYQAPDHMSGRRVKCKHCGVVFLVNTDTRTDNPDFDLGQLDELAALAETGKQDAIKRGGTMAGGPAVGARPPRAAAEGGAGGDIDDVFQQDFFEGGAPRTNTRYVFPMSRLLDEWLPVVMLAIGVLWMIREPWQRNVTGRTWVGFFRGGVFLLALFASVWPFTLMAVRAAARKLNYELPPRVGLRVLGTFALPAALVAALWLIYENSTGLFIGTIIGIVVALPVLFLMLRLIPQEAPVTFAYAAGSFVLSIVIVVAATFALNLMLVGILRSLKTEHELAVSPFGPGFRWELPTERPGRLVASGGGTPDTAGEGTDGQSAEGDSPGGIFAPTTRTAGDAPATQSVATGNRPPVGPSVPTSPGGAAAGAAKADATLDAPAAGPSPNANANTGAGDPFIPDAPVVADANAKGSQIVKDVRTVLQGQDVAQVVRPAVPGPWLAVVHADDRGMERVERWNTAEWKRAGEARVARAPGSNRYALSPDGELLAYITDFPNLSVQVWSFSANRVTRQIGLNTSNNPNLGNPTLLGFSRPDHVVVQWRNGTQAGLEVFNAKVAGLPRRIEVADFNPVAGHFAISPDGQSISVITRGAQHAALASYSLVAGGRGGREVPINEITWVPQLRVTALHYTPDGTKIAALFEARGRGLFVVWPAGGRVTRSLSNHVLAGGLQPPPCANGFAPGFEGEAFEWLDNGDTYLLYGSSVVDARSGSLLGEISLGGVRDQSAAGPGVTDLLRSTEEGSTRVDRVTLDVSKLTEARNGGRNRTSAGQGS